MFNILKEYWGKNKEEEGPNGVKCAPLTILQLCPAMDRTECDLLINTSIFVKCK